MSDTQQRERREGPVNLNTALLALLTLLITTVGFFSKHSLESIESNQKQMWDKMMPRQEIQLQIELVSSANHRIEADLAELRARMQTVEIQQARGSKP